MTKCFVVIVNFNSADQVRNGLASLISEGPDEVLLVDSASTLAGERERLSRLESDKVRVAFLENNNGFGAAVNAGVRMLSASDYDVIWVLNPDAVVCTGALEPLLNSLQQDPHLIASPKIWSSINPAHEWFVGGTLNTKTFRVTHRPRIGPTRNTLPFLPGTAIAMSAGTFRSLGGFREDLFMYWEDVDFSIRAHAAGISLRVIPGSNVIHEEGGSSRQSGENGRSRLYYYFNARNRLIVAQSLIHRKASISWIVVLAFSPFFWLTPLRQEKTQRFAKLLAVVRGQLSGMRNR